MNIRPHTSAILKDPIDESIPPTKTIGGINEGFFVETDVISHIECNALIDSVMRTFGGTRAGIRNLMQNDAVGRIASDDRLLTIAKQFLGSSATPYRATLFQKTGQANWLVAWHQDTVLPLKRRFDHAEWGPWSKKEGIDYAIAPSWALSTIIALRIHLDASTPLNGPLRVIPKSHLLGVLPERDVIEHAYNSESVQCITTTGGVVAMRPLLIHASSKATINSPRRVLHIEYAETLEFGNDVCLVTA
jgi:hypothetical protein